MLFRSYKNSENLIAEGEYQGKSIKELIQEHHEELMGRDDSCLLYTSLLKRTVFQGESVPFVLELPAYRIPSAKSVLLHLSLIHI